MAKSIVAGSEPASSITLRRIDAAPVAVARRIVADITSSREFAEAFNSNDLRGWPIAVLPSQIKKALNCIGVVISSQVIVDKIPPGKLARKHPEVSLIQYRNLQTALDYGEILFEKANLPGRGNRPTLVVLHPDRDRWWRYAVKISPGRLFISTIFRCSHKSRERVLQRKGNIVIRGWGGKPRIGKQ